MRKTPALVVVLLAPSDRPHVQLALIRAYNGAKAEWTNPETKAHGVVMPLSMGGDAGRSCREFRHAVYVGGRDVSARAKACQQEDGTWARVPS
jgi:surface antigen